MKFCFLCGKKTEKLIKGYCEECYNKNFLLIKVPKEIIVTKCSKCGKIKEKNKWKDKEIEEILKNKIEIFGKNVEIKIEKNDFLKVYAKGFLKDSEKIKEESHEVKVKIKKEVCSSCSKKSTNYYEAIIQVRGELTNDDIDSIDNIVLMKKGFYRIEEVKGGYDLFMSNKNLAKNIADFLRKRHKAEIKRSYKIVTSKEGKDIYKNIILVRISD